MEAEEIKHSEEAGCVEAELSYWIVDLQTELCNRALNSGLEERKMRHRMIPLKYLSWVFVVLSSVLSFGGALLSSLCHPCASDGSYNHTAPYFLPREMSVCHIRHKSCTPSWSQRLIKEGSRGGRPWLKTPSEFICNEVEEKPSSQSSVSTLVLVWKVWFWMMTVSVIWLMKEPIRGWKVR